MGSVGFSALTLTPTQSLVPDLTSNESAESLNQPVENNFTNETTEETSINEKQAETIEVTLDEERGQDESGEHDESSQLVDLLNDNAAHERFSKYAKDVVVRSLTSKKFSVLFRVR